MASNSSKPMSDIDSEQAIEFAFDMGTKTLGTSTFINGKVGHKISLTIVDPTTEDYSYFDSGDLLSVIRVIYTDNTKSILSSVERIS